MKRILLAGLLLQLAACGGTPRNAALKNRVSEAHLAPVSESERAAEAEAYQEVFLAEWQVAFTKGQIEGAELEIKIAKNNLASAKLGVKSAALEAKAADDAGDMNRVKSSDKAELLAEQEQQVHQLAIDRAKQSLAYLKKRLIYEESRHRSLEAKLELARAESLSAAGIQPPDFNKNTYKSQHTERASQAKSYKAAVDAEHKQLLTIEAKLSKAKLMVEATKNPGAAGATDNPAGPEPDILPPPPPADTKVPTPDESLPGETGTPESKPAPEPKPEPKPAGETTPAGETRPPAAPPKEESSDKAPAPTTGGQP
jgi:hypothetical protein